MKDVHLFDSLRRAIVRTAHAARSGGCRGNSRIPIGWPRCRGQWDSRHVASECRDLSRVCRQMRTRWRMIAATRHIWRVIVATGRELRRTDSPQLASWGREMRHIGVFCLTPRKGKIASRTSRSCAAPLTSHLERLEHHNGMERPGVSPERRRCENGLIRDSLAPSRPALSKRKLRRLAFMAL